MGRNSKPSSGRRFTHRYDDAKRYQSKRREATDIALAERRARAQVVLKKFGKPAYNMCATKFAYETESEAQYTAFVHTTPLTKLRVYRCPFCKKWHITHKDEDDHTAYDKSKIVWDLSLPRH